MQLSDFCTTELWNVDIDGFGVNTLEGWIKLHLKEMSSNGYMRRKLYILKWDDGH